MPARRPKGADALGELRDEKQTSRGGLPIDVSEKDSAPTLETPKMTDWYYGRKGQHKGPVSLEQLQELVSSGRILSTDLAWHDGLADWTPTGEIPDFEAAIAEASAVAWHYGESGQQQGPVSLLELRKLVATGSVGTDWLAWKEGMDEWAAIADIPSFAGIKKVVQKRATAKHEADVAKVSDSDLVAGFRTESKPSAAAEEIKGLFKSAKRAVRIKKLQFEISGMEKTLRDEYITAGQQVLESGAAGVDISNERSKLKGLLAEINERQERMNAVSGSSGTGSIQRELQSEINGLNEQSQDVFEAIGRIALKGGTVSDETRKKVANLETLVGERQDEVQTLLAADTSSGRKLSTGWLVSGGVVLIVAVAVGAFFWGGFTLWQTAFGDRLAANRYMIPPNTDTLFYLHAAIGDTEAYDEIVDDVDKDSLMLAEGHSLNSDDDDVVLVSALMASRKDDDDAPTVALLNVANAAEIKKDKVEDLEEREHEGQTFWAADKDAAVPHTRYLTEDQRHFVTVASETSSVTSEDIVDFTEELIEQIEKKREAKVYDELSRFIADVPDAHAVYVQTHLEDGDDMFIQTAFAYMLTAIVNDNLQLDLSELRETLVYISPEETPREVDDDVEGVVSAITFGDQISAEERAYFSSVADAKDYFDLLETKVGDSKTEVKDKDFSGSDTLKNNLRKLLGSVEIVREEKTVILKCVVPTRLISEIIEDGEEVAKGSNSNQSGRGASGRNQPGAAGKQSPGAGTPNLNDIYKKFGKQR